MKVTAARRQGIRLQRPFTQNTALTKIDLTETQTTCAALLRRKMMMSLLMMVKTLHMLMDLPP
jgi:hypothetical protein